MKDTRWLDADEQSTWVAFVTTMTLMDQALDRELQRDANMPHAYYSILAALSMQPDHSLGMGRLALFTNSSQSRLSHAVSRLEENGWVRRERVVDNRRQVVAQLTDSGLKVLQEAAPGHVAEVRRLMFDHLTPEQVQQLGAIAARIRDGLLADLGLQPTDIVPEPDGDADRAG